LTALAALKLHPLLPVSVVFGVVVGMGVVVAGTKRRGHKTF